MAPAGRLEGPPDGGKDDAGREGGASRHASSGPGGGRRRRRAHPGTSGSTRSRRAPRRLRWFLAALLLVPLVEITVMIAVGQQIGPWWTFGALVLLSFLGAVLVRHQGIRTWRRLQAAVRQGQEPRRELTDAGLVLIGGVLLVTPGFVTGAVGLFLLLPFTRPLTRVWVERLLASRLMVMGSYESWSVRGGRPPGGADVIEGEVVHDDREDPPRAGTTP